MSKRPLNRALSVRNVMDYEPRVMHFDGPWLASFGSPEMRGCWIIWGDSGNGKTTFAVRLAKYLTRFGKVVYDSIEEGLSLSMKDILVREGMLEAGRRFILLNKEPVDAPAYISDRFRDRVKSWLSEMAVSDSDRQAVDRIVSMIEANRKMKRTDGIQCLTDRLERRKSADIVIIDSLQYAGIDAPGVAGLISRFPNKLFIFISHANGKEPKGSIADAVRYMSDMKLHVKDFAIARPVSRFKTGETTPFVIWDRNI